MRRSPSWRISCGWRGRAGETAARLTAHSATTARRPKLARSDREVYRARDEDKTSWMRWWIAVASPISAPSVTVIRGRRIGCRGPARATLHDWRRCRRAMLRSVTPRSRHPRHNADTKSMWQPADWQAPRASRRPGVQAISVRSHLPGRRRTARTAAPRTEDRPPPGRIPCPS